MRFLPVRLGCCREGRRCRMCAPPPPSPDAEVLRALLEQEPLDVRVHFFGGPPPSDALLDACRGRRVHVRVRPDRLDQEEAGRLLDAGVVGIELDALTFHTPALREIRRAYAGPRVQTMIEGLRQADVEIGLVLAIGLPGQRHEDSVRDAELARTVDTVRLHPALVLRDSGLWDAHLAERYTPLSIAQAVTTTAAMLDVLEPAGVRVIRVGQQPGPDELGRAMAGPAHPSFRELVESRRALGRLRAISPLLAPTGTVTIRCHPSDQARARGPLNHNLRALRAELGVDEVRVLPDPSLPRGHYDLESA